MLLFDKFKQYLSSLLTQQVAWYKIKFQVSQVLYEYPMYVELSHDYIQCLSSSGYMGQTKT